MMRRLLSDRTGASAAEFALVLPLLLLLLFGIIDGGRWLWTYNRAAKATQMGARFAVVATPVSSAISNSYIGQCSPALTQGDLIPANCFSTITCTDASCTSGTRDQVAFRKIVDRMKLFMPEISYANVAVEYSPSGLGYAGDPNGTDLKPLVTVRIGGSPVTALQFRPIVSLMLGTVTMPRFTTTLTAEDLTGSQSN
jgi:Flp pilus assembly protein TadG